MSATSHYQWVRMLVIFTFLSLTSAISIGGKPSLLTLPTNLTTLLNPLTASINGPTCHRLAGTEGLQPSHCSYAVEVSCGAINKTSEPANPIRRNKWIWTETPGCAVAYYVPQGSGVRVPKAPECTEIMTGLIDKCAFNSSVNAGSENVAVMPDWSHDGVEELVDEAMYILAPERLTF